MYAYCFNNPVNSFDPYGEAVANIVGGVIGGVAGAALGALLANHLGLTGWKKWALISAATVGGAALGAFLGPYVAKLGAQIGAKLGIKAIPKIGSQIGRLGKLTKNLKPIIKGTTEYSLKRMAERGMTKALACLKDLRGCEMHSSVILSEVDVKTLKKLGINLTCEPVYQTKRLYQK